MEERFLGVPLLLWGAICLAVALVWVFVWPAERAAGAGGLRFFLIRWGHTITWLCLAAMAFLRALGGPALAGVANLVGLAGLAAYLGFVGATFVMR